MVHLGIFILFYLSGSRDFAVALNSRFDKKPRIDVQNQNFTYSDFLIVTLVKLIWDAHPRLSPLRECCLTILANITPYVKSISSSTAAHLLKLFNLITRPSFIFANDSNYRCCFFLLESFNNILQYQYAGNKHLVYAIIRNKLLFRRLLRLKVGDEGKKPEIEVDSDNAAGTGIQDPLVLSQDEERQKDQSEKLEPSHPILQPSQPGELPEPDVNVQQHDPEQVIPKFVPTNAWVESWQKQLPLMTIVRFLKAIVPQVKSMVNNNAEDETRILAYLDSTTIVGLLPLPHPIILRKFWPTSHALNWFHCYMWGVVFLKNLTSGTTFLDTEIKLFVVHVDIKKK